MSPASAVCQAIRLASSIMLVISLILLINKCLHRPHGKAVGGGELAGKIETPNNATFPITVLMAQPKANITTIKPGHFPELPVLAMDCGRFPPSSSTWKKNNGRGESRGMSLISLKAKKNFASSFKTVFSCWRTTNVTERFHNFGSIKVTEALAIFNVEPPRLINMSRSLLTIRLSSPEKAGEVIEAYGFIHEKDTYERQMRRVRVPGQTERHTFHFDTSNFLAGLETLGPDVEEGGKLFVTFLLRRESPTINFKGYHEPLLNTSVHLPSLRVFNV